MARWQPGTGYAVCVQPLTADKPIVRWSKAVKARVRRRNLKRRLERKVPLFATSLYEEELARWPDYFDGEWRAADPMLAE